MPTPMRPRLLPLLLLTAVSGLAGCGDATQPEPGSPASPRSGASLPDLGVGASLNGYRPLPDDNPWNRDVSRDPVDPASATLIAACGIRNLHPDFGTVWNGVPIGIPYVVVSGDQTRVPVSFHYAAESDPGPYPIPASAPVEGGAGASGDRHVLVLDRDNERLYELFDAQPLDGATRWEAGSGAIFDLRSNELRPAGWTSADAAGLPILPGLVRYDEVIEIGEIRHALRFTCPNTRRAYVPPARHWASSRTDASLPPMGMRVRLRADFDIDPFPPAVQVILRALETYGMLLADNGGGWFVSGAPDPRWNDDTLAALKTVPSSAFEVIRMEGIVAGR